jgi:hypothetical protein
VLFAPLNAYKRFSLLFESNLSLSITNILSSPLLVTLASFTSINSALTPSAMQSSSSMPALMPFKGTRRGPYASLSIREDELS